MKVLFVDDNSDSADALSALATAMGHEASVAYNGKRAVELARTTAFDLYSRTSNLATLMAEPFAPK